MSREFVGGRGMEAASAPIEWHITPPPEIQELAKKHSIKMPAVKVTTEAESWYDRKTNTIYIAERNVGNLLVWAHELCHAMLPEPKTFREEMGREQECWEFAILETPSITLQEILAKRDVMINIGAVLADYKLAEPFVHKVWERRK